jgi:hypothetical protein
MIVCSSWSWYASSSTGAAAVLSGLWSEGWGVDKIFDADATAWFARPLYDLGWLPKKPVIALD